MPALVAMHDWRARHPHRVFDVDFRKLVDDPVGVVQAMYRHFDLEVPDVLGARIAQHLRAHPRGEFGSHEYTLERYGLDREAIHAACADYIDRYEVSLDARR